MNQDDPNDFDLIDKQIVEDWPSPDEIDSLVSHHGRKKDFTYEQSGDSGKEEAGTVNQGISEGQAGLA